MSRISRTLLGLVLVACCARIEPAPDVFDSCERCSLAVQQAAEVNRTEMLKQLMREQLAWAVMVDDSFLYEPQSLPNVWFIRQDYLQAMAETDRYVMGVFKPRGRGTIFLPEY